MAQGAAQAWRCGVCGYIHRGHEPPQWCPVCGADRSEFEPYEEPAAAAPAAPRRWRCLNCGYIHEGLGPPEECPVCGAPRDRFEPLPAAAEAVEGGGRPVRVVIAGAGIAGMSAAEAVRRANAAAQITLLSREPELPYYRLNLTRFLAGELDEGDLPIHPEAWYEENRVELLRGAEATQIRGNERRVELRDGRALPYEKLILTMGAHPFVPPVDGTHRVGVTSLRVLDDVRRTLAELRPGIRCVCIGGGLLGLETAGGLARRGAEVTVLESHEWLMPRQLNRTAGEMLARHLASLKINLLKKSSTKQIVGDERAAGVLLEDGRTVPAEMVVLATGVRPNSYLARTAGLTVNKGVVVDNMLATSLPDVLAAGDVAEHLGVLYGNWYASQYQGNIAGMNAAGLRAEFGGIPRSNTLKVLGLDVFSIGRFEPEDGSYRVVEERSDAAYLRFIFHDGRMVGAVLVGDASASGPVKKAVEGGRDFSGLLKGSPGAADVVDYVRAAGT